MIKSEIEMAKKFAAKLLISIDNESLKFNFSVPEEEVMETRTLPFMSMFYLYDDVYEPNRITGKYLERKEENGKIKFIEHEMPEPMMFVYQVDIYTDNQEDMLEIGTELSKKIKVRGNYFFDDDGQPIDIFRTNVIDFSKDVNKYKKSNERIFKRSYTYELRCYYDPNDTITNEYGVILDTDISVRDMSEYPNLKNILAETK